jgi:porin
MGIFRSRRVRVVAQVVGIATITVSIVLKSVAAPPPPSTPEKPGRPTAGEAGIPTQSPATRPATEPSTEVQATPTGSDEDFLKEAATTLGVPTPQQQPDLELLRWYGLRAKVENAGVTFAGAYTADYSKNFQGGVSTASDAFRSLLDLRLNFDMRSLLNIYDGTLSVDYQNQNGQNGSDRLTGDQQGFDNIDADGRSEVAELWYQQLFLEERLRIKVGKVDANSEFAAPASGAGFLNSSFAYSPTIFLMPTYPDPAMSVNVFYNPTPNYYVQAGVYDGSGAAGVATGDYGPKKFFNGPGDYFFIGETGVRWAPRNQTLPGRFSVGGWYNTGNIPRFDGGNDDGTGGFYALAEQTLWHQKYYIPTDPVGITAFLQYGYADPAVSPVEHHVGGGLLWTGPLPIYKRENDALGVGFTYAYLSNAPAAGFAKRYEMTIEAYYGIQVTSYLIIKPDLQYILNPGGGDRDALVATVRGTVAF